MRKTYSLKLQFYNKHRKRSPFAQLEKVRESATFKVGKAQVCDSDCSMTFGDKKIQGHSDPVAKHPNLNGKPRPSPT
jgi:hypothetical protein